MSKDTPVHILVVDDEEEMRTLLSRCFELEGYTVSVAGDGTELKSAMQVHSVDLITLDLKLGGEDGFALARGIRATHNVPIIMITGKNDPIDRVVGLELGADDYIVKPFHLREVLARVRAVLRRYENGAKPKSVAVPASDAGGHAFEGFVLKPSKRELVAASGATVELTTAEFDLLSIFVERPSRVLSRDNIMDLLKGHEWSPFDRSIDSLVARLRKKIETDSENPRLIKTVRGVGYVLAVDVRQV